MKICVPEYSLSFKCTAGACKHNCCREGWEIEIDDAHAAIYKSIASNPQNKCAEQVRNGVFFPAVKERKEGLRPHILLLDKGICPFLNESGLCSLILAYDEDILCQICADHPRFRNFYPDHTETGIGLCCEEAVRLILDADFPVRYVNLRNGEATEPEHRKKGSVKLYRGELAKELDICDWAEYLLALDSIEPGWARMLEMLKEKGNSCGKENADDPVLAKIEEYLLYRHLMKDGPKYTAFLYRLVRSLYESTDFLPEKETKDIRDLFRVFSSEMEYSEDAEYAVKRKLYS